MCFVVPYRLQIGTQQVVTVMADLMGTKVDPSLLLEMEDDLSQSQSQSQEAALAE